MAFARHDGHAIVSSKRAGCAADRRQSWSASMLACAAAFGAAAGAAAFAAGRGAGFVASGKWCIRPEIWSTMAAPPRWHPRPARGLSTRRARGRPSMQPARMRGIDATMHLQASWSRHIISCLIFIHIFVIFSVVTLPKMTPNSTQSVIRST
jgi:hypothetical protein